MVEMLTAMIIMAVFFLSLHFISRIAITEPRKQEREMKMYADAGYGFKLMRKHVRESEGVLADTPGSPWVGERLVVTPLTGPNMAFGLYNNTGANSVDLFYIDDVSLDVNNVNNRFVLLSVPGPWSITFDPDVTDNKEMDAQIQVQDENSRPIFDVSTAAVRRKQ